jgi:alpha/beta superfamily hydrolase
LSNLELLVSQFGRENPSNLAQSTLRSGQVAEIKLVLSSLHINLKKLSINEGYFTKDQAVFLENLKNLIGTMKNFSLENTEIEFSQSLWDIMENHDTLSRRIHQYKVVDQDHAAQLSSNIGAMKQICDNILEPKTWKQKIHTWYNSTIGTLDQLRVEFESEFTCKRHYMIMKDMSQIDCMVILHTVNCNEAEKLEKLRFLEKSLDIEVKSPANVLSSLDSMQDPMNQAPTINSNFQEDLGSFVIICNPNANYYEFGCFDRSLIDFFLEKGINVFLWNYRDYGRSTGRCSMQNLVSDGSEIIDLVRNKIGCKHICLYGKSLGGYIATNLQDSVDLVIADRTFSSVSLLPRTMMSKWIQRVFDFYIDNTELALENFVFSDTPKIIMHDTTDEIVNIVGS